MLRDASQRASAAEAPPLASGCDAPQHEGRVRRASLAERSQASTNLRLYEIAAGAIPLFPVCYLQ